MSNDMTETSLTGTDSRSAVFSPDGLDKLIRFAAVMAEGHVTVPAHLKGNASDCLAVSMQAVQWGMNPFAVAQKTHLVHGVLGYEAQLVNAVITSMAPTHDRLHYEWYGPWENVIGKFKEKTSAKDSDKKFYVQAWTFTDEEKCGVRVWATMKGEKHPRVLELLLSQAQPRNSPLWATDPKQQLAYLAVKRWARLHCPDVILGVYTPDEIGSETPPMRDITPVETAEDLNALINAQTETRPAQHTEPEARPAERSEPLTTSEETAGKNAVTRTSQGTPESPSPAKRTAETLLADFTEAAAKAETIDELARCYRYAAQMLSDDTNLLSKATDVARIRREELSEQKTGRMPSEPGTEQEQ